MFAVLDPDTKLKCTNPKCDWRGTEAQSIKRTANGILRCPKCKAVRRVGKTVVPLAYGAPVVRDQ